MLNELFNLKKFKTVVVEYLTTQLIHVRFECLYQENKEYGFNNTEVLSKLVIAGGHPSVGWYRCIKCNNTVFIAKDRDILYDCTECNGYQFMQI